MKNLTRIFFCGIFAISLIGHLEAANCQHDSFHNETRQRDYEAVQEFVNSKRTIPLEEKDQQLTIAGDVRFTWAFIDEEIDQFKLRAGNGSGNAVQSAQFPNERYFLQEQSPPQFTIPYTHQNFAAEFNLYLDYVCDRSWAVAWVQFEEDGGVFTNLSCLGTSNKYAPQGLFGSGCCDGLCLRKAYLGYNFLTDGCQRLDVEIGRRPLYNVFDSRIQFQQNFDGALLRYGRSWDCVGNFYWNFGLFVVDERSDHYAYVTELGMLDICNYDLNIKYSFIDWKSLNLGDKKNRCGTKNPYGAEFQVHQFSLDYTFEGDCLWVPIKTYGAFLINTAAKDRQFLSGLREKIGWYVGVIFNRVCGEGDWAADICVQQTQAQAVPDSDYGGIGANGNNLIGRNHYDNISVTQGPQRARGFTNNWGFRLEGLYALTDNLSINGTVEWSNETEEVIGGENDYLKVEFSAIYAF